jgi:hypothetical protein
VTLGTGPSADTAWQPQGRCIGWLDGQDLYLEPDASYAEAQALAKVQGDALSVSALTLRKRLHERRLLVSTDRARQTLMVRRTLAEQQRAVLHMHVESLSIHTAKPDIDHEPRRNGGPDVGCDVWRSLEPDSNLAPTAHDDSRIYDRNVGDVGFPQCVESVALKIDETAETSLSGLSGTSEKPDIMPDSGEANRVVWEEI